MKIIFTKNKKLGSKFIRWGLEEPVSHVAILFDNGFILHSHINGVEPVWGKTFLESNEVVFSLSYRKQKSLNREMKLMGELLNKYDKAEYDLGSLAYFVWRGFLRKFFNKPLPEENKWNNKKAFLCSGWATVLIKNKENDMITPYELYQRLKQDKDWIDGEI